MKAKFATLKTQFHLVGGVYTLGKPATKARTLPVGTQIRVIAISPNGNALCTTRLRSKTVWGSIFVVPNTLLQY